MRRTARRSGDGVRSGGAALFAAGAAGPAAGGGFLWGEGQHDALTSPMDLHRGPYRRHHQFCPGLCLHQHLRGAGQGWAGGVRRGICAAGRGAVRCRRGGGATLNGRAIHVSGRDPGHSLVVCGSTIYDRSYTERHFAIMRYLYDRGLDYRRFGGGGAGSVSGGGGPGGGVLRVSAQPWDFAAGSLLVQEAGGCVTTLEGTTIDPLRPGSVFAANALCGGLTAELPRG